MIDVHTHAHIGWTAEGVAQSLEIAASICVYTNLNITVLEL